MKGKESSAVIGTVAAVGGGGLGAADFVTSGTVNVVGSGAGTAEVATSGGAGMVDVASAAASGTGAGFLGFFGYISGILGHIGAFFGQVAVGLLAGSCVVAGGFLLLALFAVVSEARAHRGEHVPHAPEIVGRPPITLVRPPRSLRWVHVLLPSDEGAAWVAEVTSCLTEAQNASERRRHIRGYRRAMPRLIWTSWAVHLRGARSRTLS